MGQHRQAASKYHHHGGADSCPSGHPVAYRCALNIHSVASRRGRQGLVDEGVIRFAGFLGAEHAFPFGDDGGGKRVADDVGGRPPHVQELVDAHDEQQSRFGNGELVERRRDHHKRCTGHAGHALGRQHEDEQHGHLRADAQGDVVRLGDEQRGERAVHHRAVEIERIPHRQNETGDPVGDPELFQPFKRLGIRRFRTGGGEGQQRRLPHQTKQAEYASTEEQEPREDKHCPQHGQGDVEPAHELGEHQQHAEPLLCDRRRHCAEHRHRRKHHDVSGDREHGMRCLIDAGRDDLAALAHGGDRNAEEHRKHDDLEDFVGRHRLDDRLGDEMLDEILQGHRRCLEARRRAGVRERHIEVHPGLQDVDHQEAEQQRSERGGEEPGHRFHKDPPDRRGIAHVRDAHHQSREHQRRNDHFDQAQEHRRHEIEVTGHILGATRIEPGINGVADSDTQRHGGQDDVYHVLLHEPGLPRVIAVVDEVQGIPRWRETPINVKGSRWGATGICSSVTGAPRPTWASPNTAQDLSCTLPVQPAGVRSLHRARVRPCPASPLSAASGRSPCRQGSKGQIPGALVQRRGL